mmetsp:Transcript_1488/g.4955  ORF Transcript_1488/g.4955 Transcript_1488/m.4955 type:complete len:155 (-) Transcript_1488:5233-5697(-)|eukprot:CAMPEP_0113955932 /NCGR_PEP_ID=MMETSP0011_2-20120614/1728_1 /TAXON_ID=101924 /ORGANISM="Rhodosorus marinus" /LENGTH=154 /DNA_ID=CAMNT_0000965917 /DNA_START=272 /DNA_END=736 /DNA_ORIENTATION=- /assembly_acc=CAM_ASM_000156
MRRNLSRQAQKRLMNELDGWFEGSPVPGMKVLSAESLDEWLVELVGAENTVYADERYFLKFRFPEDYPFEPPEITFRQPAPQHHHVYTNGHICLNILFDGWSPALTVTSICLSILSMLSSAKRKGVPPDNDTYVAKSHGKSPKETRWMFHDDTV